MIYDASFGVLLAFLSFVAFFMRKIWYKLSLLISEYQRGEYVRIVEAKALLAEAESCLLEAEQEAERLDQTIQLLKQNTDKQILHLESCYQETLDMFEASLSVEKKQLLEDIRYKTKQKVCEHICHQLFKQAGLAMKSHSSLDKSEWRHFFDSRHQSIR